MKAKLNRREFLAATASAASALAVSPLSAAEAAVKPFSFVLLGDLHYDKLEHHDMGWIEKNKGGDLGQIKNYSRITAEIMPKLFATVQATINGLSGGAAPVAFVLQVGDLVEGLCGTEELARKQNQEALDFIAGAKLGVPFLFTKGNHDVTGPGSVEAYKGVFHPFQGAQSGGFKGGGKVDQGFYSIEQGGALFCFFDAYDVASLDWLEAELARRTSRHCFVVIHPPVVPYGARATWHLYSSARDKARREKLLELLGRQEVFVLGGHIHKYNSIARVTAKGCFAQLAISSVINAAEVRPRDVLSGVGDYNGDQVRVEPKHSPETEKERRAVYEAERLFVRAFEYADLPGYAVVTVDGPRITAKMYAGTSRAQWRGMDLVELRNTAG